jgi:hypothetical protein
MIVQTDEERSESEGYDDAIVGIPSRPNKYPCPGKYLKGYRKGQDEINSKFIRSIYDRQRDI